MNQKEHTTEAVRVEPGEELLKQLLHLKRYEVPERARMTRNKQNIIRRIRTESTGRARGLGDLLEINFPWFFSEPKYGVALLFVAFAGLQYMGINARHAVQSDTGIYTTSTDRFAVNERVGSAAPTNAIQYPKLPMTARLFPDWQDSDTLKPVGNPAPKWQE